MRITRVDTVICRGGEGPLWDPAEQALYFIDNSGRKAHRYSPATGETRSWALPSVITALALRQNGGAVVTLRSGVHLFDFETGNLEPLLPLPDPAPFVPNDGKVDRRGRFLFGASTTNFADPAPEGGLFRLDPDRRIAMLETGIHFSNGPCWSPDDGIFYFADSWLRTIYAYDYDIESGGLTGKRVFARTSDLGGLPDGATVDRHGLLWTALYENGRIAAFRPDGRLERVIEMPVKFVSSLCFGGPDLDLLFVTTMDRQLGEEGAGAVHVIEGLGVHGLPETRYAG